MYRTKKDIDKHVENLIAKLSVKEFKTRAYSIGRLYFEVGDYASCQKYVEQYLTQKDNNAAAHKLLGQAFQKLGQKEKALDHFKISLDIDPTQTSTILDICELLADDEVAIDPGRANYWCEKAEATFPRHPITFRLRERLVSASNPDPEALIKLISSEIAARPKDVILHCRLLKHYQNTNKIDQAFEHGFNIEFGNKSNYFSNNFLWYDALSELLKHNSLKANDWQYQLLFLTVRERICLLSLTETPSGSAKSLIESNELLHAYDQALEKVAKAGAPSGFSEFHSALLQHHRGQFVLHAATYLLKKAKKDQLSWRDATWSAAPLMLIAWQTVPLDSKVNWLTHAPEKLQIAVNRWYFEGTYRCSQSGHYLLGNIQDRSQSFLDRISQSCSGHWRDKLYEKIFTGKDQLAKIKTSHFVTNAFTAPVLRLPRRIEVEAYDVDAQREYPASLHHFVWTLQNYKNFAHFKCSIFDMLTPTANTCNPETLNKFDVLAFLYCAALSTRQQKSVEVSYVSSDKPSVVPANITDLLCPLAQMKWWDCAYKFSQNELGMELTDIRATLSRGIEVVRCVDNHGLDPELLCIIGSIFGEKAKLTTSVEEKTNLEVRAALYYSSALPLLEKLKNKMTIKMPEKRLFDYTHKELSLKELNSLIEESKLYVAINKLNDGDFEKVIELLSGLKSPQAYYHLGQTYKKIAMEERNLSRGNNSIESKSKYATLMLKAKNCAYKALDRVKEAEMNKDHPLYSEIQQLIEDVETNLNKMEPDITINNDGDGKYSSDENISSGGSEHVQIRNNYHMFRNISSTPKQQSMQNLTNYRTAIDSQEPPRVDSQFLEKIENQIKNFQTRLAEDFKEQTKNWFEENRRLGNQIMNTIQSDIQNTTDQFKLLKISVDHIKDQINECRNDCKDVGELRKQIAELKKEVNKLKKASSEQNIDDSDLYNLDDDYRTNDSASTFAAQMPFQASPVMPPFNQRLLPQFPLPSNPYHLYNQSLYNLYNQYSQFGQSSGGPPLFDPNRAPINYPGVYPNPDQMYLDVAHLVPPTVPNIPSVPTVPPVPTMSSAPPAPVNVPPPATGPVTKPKTHAAIEPKDIPKSLPVNVVITSSDPLPVCTTTPAPILSVTIPPKHIKGNNTPHNYQIPMPSGNDTKVVSPPDFSFPAAGNKPVATPSTLINWGQPPVFKTTQASTATTKGNDSFLSTKSDTQDRSVVDGSFTAISPNTSLNKSRTLSERSNTSLENYDPCPDFKPIIPLPAEVKVTTGEEDETVVFSSRAKLFRFVDKQWKERGIGEIKLLKHKVTGRVRVLMRREQIHKICANHVITPEMEIKPMKNETKAYFWVANDFADETVVLEKFCVRFKTAEIAQQFYQIFEKSRLETKNLQEGAVKIPTTGNVNKPQKEIESKPQKEIVSKPQKETSKTEEINTPVKPVFSFNSGAQQNKTEFGGFTFNTTPTFKTVQDNAKNETKASQTPTTKVNIFSNLNIAKPVTSSPFSNIFGTNASPASVIVSTPSSTETPNKLNTSDTVEEFEPNVEFKPVVPLPALIDQKTGEEDENVLFEHRAKLLRFDNVAKEWKERGLGNIKILVHKENPQKVRLLMRREQIMKVCCNHAITKDMTFEKMPNMDKAVTWCAKDFSEGELVAETFCLRFKTVQLCDEFMVALKIAQSKMKDDSKAAKEEKNAAQQNNETGFGDKFKPKAGSWYCESCYTNNLESFAKCACCEQPNPQGNKQKEPNTPTNAAGWGDKFKPKLGSWECNGCFIRNEGNVDYCVACDAPRDPNMPKKQNTVTAPSENTFKFKFGLPSQTPNTPVNPITSVATSGPALKFSFGIPQSSSNQQSQEGETTSIFDGTGAHKFSFGIPSSTPEQKSSIFGTKTPSANETPLNLTSKTVTETKQPATPAKPALLPTPTSQPDVDAFGLKDAGGFDFKFKPKTPPKGKSPLKSPKSQGDESDGNEYASEDEGNHIYFSPVVPLPDKVEVVTGEENETELYGHRAKLYRFTAGEWKERGIGIVKILKHKETGKLRVVMRREQVLKICLNHALTSEIMYTPKDDKTWLFAANDYSEGELSLQQFCLRFKTKQIASEFKDAVDNARNGKAVNKESDSDKKDSDSDEVLFVSETQATDEEKQKAKELMLPENFFTYKNKEPCQGCRGCTDEESSVKSTSTASLMSRTSVMSSSSLSTPAKSSPPYYQSPMNSFYGTPANFDKTSDTSIFRTPLGSVGSNTNSVSPATPTNAPSGNDTTNKENAFTKKNIFAGLGDKPSIFGQSENKPIFGATETQANAKGSILAPPKLSTQTPTFGGSQSKTGESKLIFGTSQSKPEESKSIFGTSQSKPEETKSIFGTSQSKPEESKSIFGTSQSKPEESKSIFGTSQSKPEESKSIFGTSQSKPEESKSIFGTAQSKPEESKSIFGTSQSKPEESKPIFGTSQSKFGESKSIFGTSQSKPEESKSIFGTAQSKSGESTSIFGSSQSKPEEAKSIFGTSQSKPDESKSIFGMSRNSNESKPVFGNNNTGFSTNKSIFSFSSENKKEDAQPAVKSLFGEDPKPVNLFSDGSQGSLFGPGALSGNQQKPSTGLFGNYSFGSGNSVFGKSDGSNQGSTWTFAKESDQPKQDEATKPHAKVATTVEKKTPESTESSEPETPFKVDNSLTFAALSSSGEPAFVPKTTNFQWEGAGQQLFTSAQKAKSEEKSPNESGAGEDSTAGADEEYDPHYEPIVPLPDKIVVTTGEEDEEKLFSERCKLYRYDDKTREWKERGVGEMKILYHPERKTYRFLLRREQVHKAVLNMLLFMDLELLPMKNSDRAWTWAGRNFAENPSGEQETLAVRFKSVDLAKNFQDKVVECVRKLQSAAAQAIREESEKPVTLLRLPKGMQDSARADPGLSTKVVDVTEVKDQDQTDGKQNGEMKEPLKQVQFQEPDNDEDNEEEEEAYGHDYNYDYYNDEDEESATYYACDGVALVRQGNSETACENAHVQLLFDQDIYSPKILVTDNDTGEILADMLIHTETDFQLDATACTWSGTDYTSNDPVDKTVTMEFHDPETAVTFYDSCETSKGATYSSIDPES